MRSSSFRRRASDESGIALISAIIVGSIMMMLVAALGRYSLSALNLSRHDQDWNAALAAAESGIDHYLFRLNQDENYWQYSAANPPPDGNAAFTTWVPVPGNANDGKFRYDIDVSTRPVDGTIKVTSTGKVQSTTRTVHSTLRKRGFLDYLYFSEYETKDPVLYNTASPDFDAYSATVAADLCAHHYYDVPPRDSNCGDIQFASADVIKGPLHSNDAILMSGSPQFQGTVSTSWNPQSGNRYRGTATPVFSRAGDPALEAAISMPPSNTSVKVQADAALGGTGCLYTGPTSITLTSNGKMNVTSPYTLSSNCATGTGVSLPANGVVYVQGVPASPSNPNYRATCSVGSGNPLGYPITGDITSGYGCFDGDVFLSGTLKGSLTIASADNIVVVGNTTYEGGTAGTDLLGLLADNYVQVYHPVNSSGAELASFTNVVIHAATMTIAHSFIVQNFRSGTPRGTLTVFGAIAQLYRGPVGTGSGGSVATGFAKDYNYDQKLKYLSPPYFIDPVKSAWQQVTWAEVPPAYT